MLSRVRDGEVFDTFQGISKCRSKVVDKVRELPSTKPISKPNFLDDTCVIWSNLLDKLVKRWSTSELERLTLVEEFLDFNSDKPINMKQMHCRLVDLPSDVVLREDANGACSFDDVIVDHEAYLGRQGHE